MRIDYRQSPWQFRRRFVMINDDDLETELASSFDFYSVGNPAIHRHDEPDTARFQSPQPCRIETVPLFNAMRHVIDRLSADGPQKAYQQRSAGGAVDVIIPPYADLLFVLDCSDKSCNRGRHIGHIERRRQILAQTR